MIERRKYIRVNDKLHISYKVITDPSGLGENLSENISGLGLRLPFRQRLDPGDIIDLFISLPGETGPVAAKGRVVWINNQADVLFPYSLGVKFIELSVADQQKLDTYIQHKLTGKDTQDIQWFG